MVTPKHTASAAFHGGRRAKLRGPSEVAAGYRRLLFEALQRCEPKADPQLEDDFEAMLHALEALANGEEVRVEVGMVQFSGDEADRVASAFRRSREANSEENEKTDARTEPAWFRGESFGAHLGMLADDARIIEARQRWINAAHQLHRSALAIQRAVDLQWHRRPMRETTTKADAFGEKNQPAHAALADLLDGLEEFGKAEECVELVLAPAIAAALRPTKGTRR